MVHSMPTYTRCMHVSVPGVFAHLDSWRPYLRVQLSMRRILRIFRCSSFEVGFGLYINSMSRQSHTRHFTWIDVRDGKQTRQSEGASRMVDTWTTSHQCALLLRGRKHAHPFQSQCAYRPLLASIHTVVVRYGCKFIPGVHHFSLSIYADLCLDCSDPLWAWRVLQR